MNGNELKEYIREHGSTEHPIWLDKNGQLTMHESETVYQVNQNQYGGGFYAHIVKAHRTSGNSGCSGTPCDVLRFIAGRVLFGEVDNS